MSAGSAATAAARGVVSTVAMMQNLCPFQHHRRPPRRLRRGAGGTLRLPIGRGGGRKSGRCGCSGVCSSTASSAATVKLFSAGGKAAALALRALWLGPLQLRRRKVVADRTFALTITIMIMMPRAAAQQAQPSLVALPLWRLRVQATRTPVRPTTNSNQGTIKARARSKLIVLLAAAPRAAPIHMP